MLNWPPRALLGLLLVSCAKANTGQSLGAQPTTAQRGALVARVGAVELREDDVKRAMERDPGASPGRFESPAARQELIDGLIRFELLAQAAEREGFTKDPDAVHALQQIAVTKLVNATLGTVAAPESVTQADIEREYLARQATEFTLPEARHVRHIRVADAKQAAHIVAQAKQLAPDDDPGFAKLAASTTQDSATRAGGGDLGFIDKNSRISPALMQAIVRLKTPGEVVGPLEIDAGYEILRLVSLRATAVSPLSSVEEPLRQRLYRERRAKALDEFVSKLRTQTKIEIAEAAPAASRSSP